MTQPKADVLHVAYNEEQHGSKYSQADFDVPVELVPFDEGDAQETVELLKNLSFSPKLELYSKNMEGEAAQSEAPHHDKGDKEGGGAPFDIKLLNERLGNGQANWADFYRGLKNDPNHPVSMVAKYLVHVYNNKEGYKQGPEKVRELDQAFRDLHFQPQRFNKHLNMGDVVRMAKANAQAFMGLYAFRAALHNTIKKGVGIKVRDIHGEPYVALTRALESPIMSHEHALRSFAHGPSSPFGSYKFNTWVPMKDVWYSFDLGPTYPNGNMGPEDEFLVSNSGPRYKAEPSDCTNCKYISTGKEDGEQNRTHLPPRFFHNDVGDAKLAQLTQGLMVKWGNASRENKEYEAKIDKLNQDRDNNITRLQEERQQISEPFVAKKNKLTEDRRNGLMSNEEYQTQWKTLERERADATALIDAEFDRVDQDYYKALGDIKPPADLKELRGQVKGILNHSSLGPITANLLRAHLQNDGFGSDILKDDLNEASSVLATEQELAAKANTEPWVLTNKKIDANTLMGFLKKSPEEYAHAALNSPNLTSEHTQFIVDNVNDPQILLDLASQDKGTDVVTKEQREQAAAKIIKLNKTGEISLNHKVSATLADHIAKVSDLGNLDSRTLYHLAESVSPEKGVEVLSDPRLSLYAKKDWVRRLLTSNTNLSDDQRVKLLQEKVPTLDTAVSIAKNMLADKAPVSNELQEAIAQKALALLTNVGGGHPSALSDLYMRMAANNAPISEPAVSMVVKGAYAVRNVPTLAATARKLVRAVMDLERSPKVSAEMFERMWPTDAPPLDYKIVRPLVEVPPSIPEILVPLATVIARRREYEKLNHTHIIQPFPADLAKSEDPVWDATVAEWLSSAKHSKGYWYGTGMDAIHDIVERGSILPQPTKRLLEGKAVYAVKAGSLEFLSALKEWAKKHGQEPAILYFETDVPPEKDPAHPKQVYWTEEVPIKNDRIEEDDVPLTKSQELELLVKYQTALTFPKLGVGDDRKDTQLATTPQQEAIATKVIAHKGAKYVGTELGQPVSSKALANEVKDIPATTRGTTVGGEHGVAPVSFRFFGSGQPTSLHEDQHKIFARVADKYGPNARGRLATHLWRALPATTQRVLSTWLEAASPNYKKMESGPLYYEEAIAHLLNYLNNPDTRNKLNAPPKFRRFFDTALKRAHRQLQAVAGVVTPEWLNSDEAPWRVPLKGTAAYQDALTKSFEDRFKQILYSSKHIEDWEHAVAAMMAGEDLDMSKTLAAAKFLSGKEPDESKFVMAMRLFNDPERAALYAAGMPDDERNLKALRAAKELTEMSKSDGLEVMSIQPTNDESSETATKIQRGVEYGLIKPLKLKGKHSSGTQIVKDPETDEVWLLKPGSGKMSPGKGISEEKASMSAREAAFWHAAKVMGLDSYVPRTDMLLVNAQEWAAVALVPFNYKTMDKMTREDAGAAVRILEPYRKTGVLHRWAVMDWILGNVDSHGQNLLTDGKDVKLIDHGSTFAGRDFDPAHDTKSFIPFYLRAWAGKDFAQMSPEERLAAMPSLDQEAAKEYSAWLESIDDKRLMVEVAKYGIDPEPVSERLRHLKAVPTYHGILECWAGLREWQ